MNDKNFQRLTKLLAILMLLLMVFNVFVLSILPRIARWYMHLEITSYHTMKMSLYYYILGVLYISGSCSLVILNALRKLFKSCELENPFIQENAKSLKIISICSLIIALVFATKIWVINSFLTIIVFFVFTIAFLFSYVLFILFKKAIYYKEEHDYTV